jgi:hypothetical protein
MMCRDSYIFVKDQKIIFGALGSEDQRSTDAVSQFWVCRSEVRIRVGIKIKDQKISFSTLRSKIINPKIISGDFLSKDQQIINLPHVSGL